jgi:hypothetical protein
MIHIEIMRNIKKNVYITINIKMSIKNIVCLLFHHQSTRQTITKISSRPLAIYPKGKMFVFISLEYIRILPSTA